MILPQVGNKCWAFSAAYYLWLSFTGLKVSTDKYVAASVFGFIAVNDILQVIMDKYLIKKKEVKIQPGNTAMALISVDTLIKPDKPLAKNKKGRKLTEVRWVMHAMEMSCTVDWLKPLCIICGVTLLCHVLCNMCVTCDVALVCHVWFDTCLSPVMWHLCVTCDVTLVCHVWCDTAVSRVVWHLCVTCDVTRVSRLVWRVCYV